MTRNKFDPKAPIAHFLINRGVMPASHLEIIERCYQEVDREELDHKTAIGLTATGLITGGVMLAALGVTPFLLPAMASVAVGGLGVWNHPLRAQRREDEADFLRSNAGLLPLIAARIEEGHPAETIKAAYSEAFRAWRSTGKPDLDVMALGATAGAGLVGADGLPCVEVQAATAAATDSPNVHGHTPLANAPGHQPIAVHAHSHITNVLPSGSGATPAKTASPAQVDRRITAPDLGAYPDVTERMTALLEAMNQSGFPLGSILKRPFVWCCGGSQSGKTSAAMLLSAARIAMGEQIGYLSIDSDVELLKWSSLSLGPERYADELAKQADRIRTANKNQLRGTGICVDEMYGAFTEWGIDLNQVMGPLLQKGAKVKASFIGISQQDTSGAHGLTNIDAAWRQTRSVLEAIHEFDEHGEPYPSGRYLYSHAGGPKEEWTMPEWMLVDLNNYGDPCPVVWLLNRFPELRQGHAQPTPSPTRPAPAWASREVVQTSVQTSVQTPVQVGSGTVQDRFSGSGSVQGSNHGSEPVQGLNLNGSKTFGELNLSGSEFMNRFEPPEPTPEPANSSQFFTNLNLNRSDAIDRISGLRDAGLNQAQIIQALWNCRKGGSKGYTESVSQYKELMGD